MKDDQGSAVVEFTVLAVCLMVPLVYVVLAIMRVQSAAMAVTTAAREAARAYSLASSESVGSARARTAMRISLEDQGVSPARATVSTECESRPCLTPGATIAVEVSTRVTLPMLPDSWPVSIPVSATHVATVDRFRASP